MWTSSLPRLECSDVFSATSGTRASCGTSCVNALFLLWRVSLACLVTASSFCVCSHMMRCLRLLLSLPTAFASAHALSGRSTDSPQSHEESREGCRGKGHPVTFRLCCGRLSPGCRGNLHVSLLDLTLAQGETSVSVSYNQPTNQPTNLIPSTLNLKLSTLNPKPQILNT